MQLDHDEVSRRRQADPAGCSSTDALERAVAREQVIRKLSSIARGTVVKETLAEVLLFAFENGVL